MEKNMEEIAKIFKINKTGIMQTFIILIICSVAENIYQGIYERILTLPIGTDILLWLVTLIIAAVSAVVVILLIKKQQNI
jgi:ABC-type multidrug transport system permease subunit